LADSSWAAAALKRLEKKEQVTYQVLGYRLIPLAVHLELGGKQQVTYKSWTRELALLKIFDAPAIAKKRKQVGFALLDKDGNLVLGRCGIGLLPAALISREDSDVPHRACWPPFRPAYDVQSIPNEDGQGG
jgi:hypothetical protein